MERVNLFVLFASICSQVVVVAIAVLPAELKGRVNPSVGEGLEHIHSAQVELVVSVSGFVVKGNSKIQRFD